MVGYLWLRYSNCGQNVAITFEIAPINFVFYTLYTMESTWRCQLCDLESGRHRVCVNEPHRQIFQHIGNIDLNIISMIGLFCSQLRLEMA